jgi:23S rRNA (cytidine2498-2'-O)-methyltransferase
MAAVGVQPVETGAGWTLAEEMGTVGDMAFPHLYLPQAEDIGAASVNAMAEKILEIFSESLRGERIEGEWPLVWRCAAGAEGLGRRMTSVAAAFEALLRKKFSRVAKLAASEPRARLGPARGFFIFFAGFDRAFVSREAYFNGQRRMADDPRAPSRSYLKVEEAYGLLDNPPRPGETVADLGAAPGGWSYSAAKRGARVVAVDNGPLKGGALSHPGIDHRREDAFRFRPAAGQTFDWLFCDLVEEPHHVLDRIVRPWLENRWCRRFVVNLKFGRVNPVKLLHELRAAGSPFLAPGWNHRVRHLYHDREEFTAAGQSN